MSWTLETQTDGAIEWAQYVDVEAAEGWRLAAASWVGANIPDRWEDQRRALVSLGTCLGAIGNSCDLPLQSFEPIARTLLTRDPGPDPLAIGYPASPWRQDAFARLRSVSNDARAWPENQWSLDLQHRIGWTREGAVIDTALDASSAPATPRGADFQRIDAANYGGSFWRGAAFSEWYPPWGAAERVAWGLAVVPGLWHWTQMQAAAELCEANGWRDLVSRSRAWVKAKNLLTAKAVGGAIPEDIITATAAALELRGAGPPRTVRAIYGAVSAAISLAVPIGPAVALVAAGIIEGLYALGAAAVAYQVDLWGRREPVLETERLTGTITTRERRPPTHTPPRNWTEHMCPAAWRGSVEGTPVDGGGGGGGGRGRPGTRPTVNRSPRRVEEDAAEVREQQQPPPPSGDASGGGGLGWLAIAAMVARAFGLW